MQTTRFTGGGDLYGSMYDVMEAGHVHFGKRGAIRVASFLLVYDYIVYMYDDKYAKNAIFKLLSKAYNGASYKILEPKMYDVWIRSLYFTKEEWIYVRSVYMDALLDHFAKLEYAAENDEKDYKRYKEYLEERTDLKV